MQMSEEKCTERFLIISKWFNTHFSTIEASKFKLYNIFIYITVFTKITLPNMS